MLMSPTRIAAPLLHSLPSCPVGPPLVLAVALLALWPAVAPAGTIAVPGNAPTIKAALALARPGDIVLVECGVYRESGIRVPPGINLWSGTLQPDCVTIDAGGQGRVLEFAVCDSTTSVVGFTLRGGATDGDGGAVLCRDASPRLARCRIESSRARRGGGIAVLGDSAPRLEECTITGNEADDLGGGVFWQSAAAGRLVDGRISGNEATAGGGLAAIGADGLALTRMTIGDNRAGAAGGGVFCRDGGPRLDRCLLVGNIGGLGGGALAAVGGKPQLVGCTLADNDVDVLGGGLLLDDASPRLERTILAFNAGAALVVEGAGQPVLASCNIYGHPGGDWNDPVASLAGIGGNFSADPRFCRRESGDYGLHAASPCLPGNRSGSLVGARPRGCN